MQFSLSDLQEGTLQKRGYLNKIRGEVKLEFEAFVYIADERT